MILTLLCELECRKVKTVYMHSLAMRLLHLLLFCPFSTHLLIQMIIFLSLIFMTIHFLIYMYIKKATPFGALDILHHIKVLISYVGNVTFQSWNSSKSRRIQWFHKVTLWPPYALHGISPSPHESRTQTKSQY